jgi:hypothetical protein
VQSISSALEALKKEGANRVSEYQNQLKSIQGRISPVHSDSNAPKKPTAQELIEKYSKPQE